MVADGAVATFMVTPSVVASRINGSFTLPSLSFTTRANEWLPLPDMLLNTFVKSTIAILSVTPHRPFTSRPSWRNRACCEELAAMRLISAGKPLSSSERL